MDQREILSKVDHTLLKPEAAWEEIRALCDEAVKWGTASVCIPPCYVGQAAEYLGGRLPVCTVVGFPNGYSTTQAKLFETREAQAAGAQEIDMTDPNGWTVRTADRSLTAQWEVQLVITEDGYELLSW